MLTVEGSVVVRRPPGAVLDWISDLERYRRADTKIGAVLRQDPDLVRYRGRVRRLPTPVMENTVHRDGDRSLAFRGSPRHWMRHVLDFEGTFTCEPVDGGTRVVHRESFGFKPAPARVLLEAWLRRWLQRDIEDEVVRLRELVEAES
jgi:hypothetical protein